jgi:Transposase/Transposase IS116/IS110/IS902 family
VALIFVGHDWSEDHHDVVVLDADGERLASARLEEGVEGVAGFHSLIVEFVDDAAEVVVGTETDRGLFVGALVAAGYQVFAINPKAVDRYRDRHRMAGGKSDATDAKVLADLVRTDRHLHRTVAADSELVEGLKVLSRAHKDLIWQRQGQINHLRSALREYYPAALVAFGADLAHGDALAVLALAPTPEEGRRLSRARVAAALRRAGRQRNIERRAGEIQAALRAEELAAPGMLSSAFGAATRASVAVLATMSTQIAALETEMSQRFDEHPDAEIHRSLPGLGVVLGARVIAEFGDDPNRYESAKARKNYAGTPPVTHQSGKLRLVSARKARNQRLADACYRWEFCSLHASPGARAYYDALRARGKSHHAALWQLANRWVGILHGCLRSRVLYDETVAWGHHLVEIETGAA